MLISACIRPCRVATAAGLKTAWSDKAIQYQVVAGPGDPINISDRITEFRPVSDASHQHGSWVWAALLVGK